MQAKTMARLSSARVYGADGKIEKAVGKSQRLGFAKTSSGAFAPQTAYLGDARLIGAGADQRPVDLDNLIDAVRERVGKVGLEQTMKLSRFFHNSDTDRSGALDSQEFVRALLEHGLLETEEECQRVFQYFDKDQTGTIDWMEFVNLVKGQLPAKRRAVVQEAFKSLDVNGDGVLTVEDLKLKFRSFAHPQVSSGEKTEEEIFSQFLASFDSISRDGEITLAEFEHYYEFLSATIPSDKLFIACIRNAWHLHGATGGACLRVHITFGSPDHHSRARRNEIFTKQQRVDIRPDLPCSVHDPRFFDICRQRLKEMGFENVESIQVLGRD